MTLRNHLNLFRWSGLRWFRRRQIKPPFPLRIGGRPAWIEAPPTAGSQACYCEIVALDQYGVMAGSSLKRAGIKVIADVGANFGMFSVAAAAKFPAAAIFAYEPNPEPFRYLQTNAAGRNISPRCAAVAARAGSAYLSESGDSTTRRIGGGTGLPVACIAGADLADGKFIDLLKLDCEGSEWDILDAQLLARVANLRMEYHLLSSDQSLERLYRMLKDGGHRVIQGPPSSSQGQFGIVWSKQA